MNIPEWGSLIIKVPEKLQYLNKEVATLSRVHNQPRTRKGVKGIRLVGVKDWRPVDTVQEVAPQDLPPDLKRAKERAERQADLPVRPVGRPPLQESEKKKRPIKEKRAKMGRPPKPDLPRMYYFLTPAMRAIYNEYRFKPISEIPTKPTGVRGVVRYNTRLFGSQLNPRQKVRSIQVYMKLLTDYPKLQEEFKKIGSGQYYKFDGNTSLWEEISWVCNIETMEDYVKGRQLFSYSYGRTFQRREEDIAEHNTDELRKVIPNFDYDDFRAEIIEGEKEPDERPDTPLAEAEDVELVFNDELGVWIDDTTDLYYGKNDIDSEPLGQVIRGKLTPFKKSR